MVDLVLNDVYKVICELYAEEIIPTLHEIRRKLQKNHSSLVDAKWLLDICSNDIYQRFRVVNLQDTDDNQNAGDLQRGWAITLPNRPLVDCHITPVDPADLVHVFQCAVNLASARTYDQLDLNYRHSYKKDNNNVARIGGRYLFAEYLRTAGPKHFRKLPLGRLMRLVQAALDAKILVYQDNSIVPAVLSSTTARLLVDRLEKNKSNPASFKQRYIQRLRRNVITLLREKPTQLNLSPQEKQRKGPRGGLLLTLKESGDSISLCKLPSLYRHKYKEELDYTSCGYHKLADFIRSEIPECKVDKGDTENTYERVPKYTPEVNDTPADFFYIPSTTLLFPLAMSSSRLTEKAVQCLVSNW